MPCVHFVFKRDICDTIYATRERFCSSILIMILCVVSVVITLFYLHGLLSVQAVSEYTMAQNDPRIPNLQDTFTPFGLPLSGVYKR